MRKFLLFLLMSLMTTMAWGVHVVTFNSDEITGLQSTVSGEDCMTRDCVTICCTYGAFAAAQYRFGKNSVTTVSSTCGTIIKIEFVCIASGDANYGPGCFTAGSGEYNYEDKNGIWVGAETQVEFTAVTSQVRAVRIDVYIDDSGVLDPQIRPLSGTYYEPIQVTVTCPTADAKIYYTLDGSDPTAASTQYTAPFMLNSDATVKAVAELEGEMSGVMSARYEIVQPVVVNNIAEYQELDDGTAAKFANPVYVVAQNKANLYVKDDSGYAIFYGDCGQFYMMGDMIPAGFCGNKTTYSCEPELNSLAGFQPAAGNSPIEPEVTTVDQIGPALFAHYVMLRAVTLTRLDDGRTYILTDEEGNSCPVYFGMGVSLPTNLNYPFDISGIVGSYRNGATGDCIYQLLPLGLCYIDDPLPIGFGTLDSIDDNTEVTMGYDATIIGQAGNYLYAFDETGYGLVFGNVGHYYKTGDVIPCGFGGLKTTYDCEPELKNPRGFQEPIGHVDLEAEEITCSQVGHSMWGHYVVIRNVRVNPGGNELMDEQGHTCSYYNRFGIWIPEYDDKDQLYDVYGVIGSYKCNYQFLPLRFEGDITPVGVCCIEDLFAQPEGKPVQFECPLAVICQSGARLFVKDKCDQYSLIYGNGVGGPFVNGDSIIGSAYWTRNNGLPQIVPPGEWQVVAHGPKVPPVGPFCIEDVSQEMVHWYVYFEDMTVVKNEEFDRYYTMIDEYGDEMPMYNQFNIEIPTYVNDGHLYPDVVDEDLFIGLNAVIYYILHGKWPDGLHSAPMASRVDGENRWEHCRVEGILAIYRDVLELMPTLVSVGGTGPDPVDPMERYDVNKDGVINVSDANEIINIILNR